MPRLPIRCLLFISSYFPLVLIFSIVLSEKYLYWAIGIFLFGLASVIILVLYFWIFATREKTIFHEKIMGVQRRDGDIMSYFASYLIPFITFTLDGWRQIASIAVVMLVLLVLYVTSNMIYINPMLSFAGFHLYEVTIEDSELSHFLITRRRVMRGRTIAVVRIGEAAFLETKDKARCKKW